MANGTRRRRGAPPWTRLGYAELLDVRLCDLELEIEGTALAARLDRLDEELEEAGLRFRPHVWLSSDWFSPDGVPGFAVPFHLAHPRLLRLEARQMLEAEGGTYSTCMQVLRHETGHAVANAYRLTRRKRWREVFGPNTEPYRASYVPDPGSRDFVQHLGDWYSQSHPSEDFAETFAVWLQPRSNWRTRYADWPALAKLECVDELMAEVADEAPFVRRRTRPDSIASERRTLREYYADKKRRYRGEETSPYDERLRTLFAGPARNERAAAFLRRRRSTLRRRVSDVTGQNAYVVDPVLGEMILRTQALGLRRSGRERPTLFS